MRRRIWGWMMFDWASQPYATLLLTFIFAPYFATVVGDPVRAQTLWGAMLGVVGICIALLAPVLGAVADSSGRRTPWIVTFSVIYTVAAFALWWAVPASENVIWILVVFGAGLWGMEFATVFTNAMLPDLGAREEIGRISGTGMAWGYAGGVLSLIFVLLLLAENDGGTTLLGGPPILGLDPAEREGTRAVGPFTALWYLVFMIPFFLWVREAPGRRVRPRVLQGLADLGRTLRRLPSNPSLGAYLASSMFYRDALTGMYTFGGIYATGVLGWSVIDTGIFGILAATSAGVFCWIGGRADSTFGPKPVIIAGIVVLIVTGIVAIATSRGSVFGIAVPAESALPDITFYFVGMAIGAAGGIVQAASRTMLVRQADVTRMTEAFGLYALAGKATSFLAPASIAIVTDATGSQRAGIAPLILLFLIGLVLLLWVKPDGKRAVTWSAAPSPNSP
ncbi:MFS transporter [Roseitranquillus sediminis]|uniref:MFS transporter n=1 Tax=Roseitranquillus sediminis TaxID=2809051 RepID=UPI001D0CBAC2|nr:MFS transporter [Roseitranquillus sediminis]MBM9596152.1 MFS transporter [Roseitranquillus sediminis]